MAGTYGECLKKCKGKILIIYCDIMLCICVVGLQHIAFFNSSPEGKRIVHEQKIKPAGHT